MMDEEKEMSEETAFDDSKLSASDDEGSDLGDDTLSSDEESAGFDFGLKQNSLDD